jgi:hypothetical protein
MPLNRRHGPGQGLFVESLMAAIASGDEAPRRSRLPRRPGGEVREACATVAARLRRCRSAARSRRLRRRGDGATLVVSREPLAPSERLTDR